MHKITFEAPKLLEFQNWGVHKIGSRVRTGSRMATVKGYTLGIKTQNGEILEFCTPLHLLPKTKWCSSGILQTIMVILLGFLSRMH